MNIPEDVMKLAEATLDAILCECTESCGGTEGLRQDAIGKISRAIFTDREARTGWSGSITETGDLRDQRNRLIASGIAPNLDTIPPSPSLRETEGEKETVDATEWRYEIKYGPDGEANYAWVYWGRDMVATMRTHHAMAICGKMNSSALLLEAEKALGPFGKLAKRFEYLAGDDTATIGVAADDLRAARSTVAKIRGRG